MVDRRDRLNALRDAVYQFGEAWARGDLTSLERLLSPTYTHTDVFGAFHSRSSWLDYVSQRTGRTTAIGFSDLQERLFGDVAIITGINDLQGPGALNATDQKSVQLRFTQIWVWHEGQWRREAFQATLVAPETAS